MNILEIKGKKKMQELFQQSRQRKFRMSIVLSSIGAVFVLSLFALPSFLTFTSFAAAPVFSAPINLSNDANQAVNPNVINVGKHVYVAWSESSRGILFRESPNGGVTWVPPTSSAALRLSPSGGVANTPLISANGTNVYVVWAQTVSSISQIFFAASKNNGQTFGTAIQLTTDTSGSDTPVVASWGSSVYVGYDNISTRESYVLSSTNAGASWTKSTGYGAFHEPQLAAWKSNAYAVSNQGLATSHNKGSSWTNETIPPFGGQVPPVPTTMSESWIAAWGTNVYVAYETKGPCSTSGCMVNYTISHNSGNTWSTETELSTTLPNSWAPMLAAHGSSAWIATHTYPGGAASQVYVYTSKNSGTTWGAPVDLSGMNGDTSFPFTVATSDGTHVFVAWADQTSTSTNTWVFLVSYSANGGSTWTSAPGINVSQNPSGTQASTNNDIAQGAIASFGTHCYAVWQYTNGASNQIYFSSS